jgi:hypothetical protein
VPIAPVNRGPFFLSFAAESRHGPASNIMLRRIYPRAALANVLVAAALVAAAPGLAGCAHLGDLQKEHERGHGTVLVYSVAPDRAWDTSESILRGAGAETVEEHRDKGYMVASTTLGAGGSAGTYIGVWIEPVGADHTKVSVITKRKVEAAIITALTEDGFHKKFGASVGSEGVAP